MTNKKHWIETRLNQEEMDFLLQAVSEENKEDWKPHLAADISKSELLYDKDNWFYETVLKKLTEKMFYKDWDAYYKYHIEKEEPPPEFEMDKFWVNYQKQHEFNPLHFHACLYSFVVFMKIPTHWKEQHERGTRTRNKLYSSGFMFVWSEKDKVIKHPFPLSSEDEGRMLFFPAWLHHQVYPFYDTEEERITISGNIRLYDPNRPKELEIAEGGVEEKENMLKIMENNVRMMKEEMKQMKKVSEKR